MALHVEAHPHFLEGKGPRVSPHPVTTHMFSCSGPQPNSLQLPLAGCATVMPGSLPTVVKADTRTCPVITWGPTLGFLPGPPLPKVLPDPQGGTPQGNGKVQNEEEGKSEEADVSIAEGNRNKNQRGKKQGSRLLYNSWFD